MYFQNYKELVIFTQDNRTSPRHISEIFAEVESILAKWTEQSPKYWAWVNHHMHVLQFNVNTDYFFTYS